MLDLFIDGIAAIATPDTLALMILGVIVGIIFGSVPGLTAVTGIALFLPVTYSLGPIKGMALLMAIYIGAVRWSDCSHPDQHSRHTGLCGHLF